MPHTNIIRANLCASFRVRPRKMNKTETKLTHRGEKNQFYFAQKTKLLQFRLIVAENRYNVPRISTQIDIQYKKRGLIV